MEFWLRDSDFPLPSLAHRSGYDSLCLSKPRVNYLSPQHPFSFSLSLSVLAWACSPELTNAEGPY